MTTLSRQLSILVFGIMCALTIPILVQQGMFIDGVLYASVAKNMAEGYGSIFAPRFSEIGIASSPIFYEYPPLVFAIQSLFFSIFKSHFLSERIYSFTTLIVTYLIFNLLWKEISKNLKGIEKMSWLAALIWITIPLVYWGYMNNAQENTMGVFTLTSSLFTIKYLFRTENKKRWLLLAGLFAFLASYSKGVPGLFVLGIIPIHAVVFRSYSIKKYVLAFLLVLSTVIVCYLLVLAYEPSRDHLMNYLNSRLLGRINNSPTVHSRFVIIYRIFWELIYGLGAVLIVLFLLRKKLKKNNWLIESKKWIIFLFLIGLSASAPVALTMVLKGFYILPSFPYFAMAIALLIAKGFQFRLRRIKNKQVFAKRIVITNYILYGIIVVLAVSLYRNYSRDKDLLQSVDQIQQLVPERSSISVQKKLWNNWKFQCYMMRYGTYSFDPFTNRDYFITSDSIPTGYSLVKDLPKYQLYRRNK